MSKYIEFRYIFILTYLISINSNSFCQNQGNIWYFGGDYNNLALGGAGLDFNTGSPVHLNNSAMHFTNGCSSYCNSVGELLFYSNGVSVYDRSHTIMFNGDNLGGDLFTPQSILIVPFSKDTNKYFLFTNDSYTFQNKSAFGLHFSIIDMKMNNGLGAILNPKAINLLKNTGSQLTGCLHSNGEDFWVITLTNDSCKLYAYQVINNEIKVPVISSLNFEYIPPINMEISPDGKRIALKAKQNSYYKRFIIEFNTTTGIFSNPFSLNEENEINFVSNTGCSFSPSGNLFYDIEYVVTSGEYLLFQYDLNASNIYLTKTFIASLGNFFNADMQIGPDNKIYIAGDNKEYIDHIESPDSKGINCNYKSHSIYLGGKKSGAFLPNEILYNRNQTSINIGIKNTNVTLKYFSNSKKLIFNCSDEKIYNILIYNINSQLICKTETKNNSLINIGSIPIGIYIYIISINSNLLEIGKIIVN